MRICDCCGRVFDELPQSKEDGTCYCPVCGSETDTGDFCEVCHEIAIDDCLVNGVCDACIDDESKRFSTQVQYGKDRTSFIEINGLVAYVFTNQEINDILVEALKQRINCKATRMEYMDSGRDFCLDDTNDFAEWLKENN